MRNEDNDNTTVPASNLEQNTGDESLAEKIFKRQDTPVSIHVHSIRKRLADADGISAKAAIDGIVNSGLLRDDSPQYVRKVSYSQQKGSEEITVITIDDGQG